MDKYQSQDNLKEINVPNTQAWDRMLLEIVILIVIITCPKHKEERGEHSEHFSHC